MGKRGGRCPDCHGSHGRGYYKCLAPYKNYIEEDAPRREPETQSADDQLTVYFSGEGYARFGWNGDECGMSPVQTALDALREYDALLKTDAGSKSLAAMLYQRLVDAGLVPK